MKSILILFAHPSLEKSRIQRAWLDAIDDLSGVTVRDLYQLYPEFDVDIIAEQEALSAHDIIVMQHPMYWYSTPSLLKQWQDLVLTHGWAYGAEGNALKGKRMLSAISMGAPAEAYQPTGFHGVTVGELLAPIRQTARLCKMTYLPPFLQHGTLQMDPDRVVKSALDYRAVLQGLRDETIDPASLADASELRVTQASDAQPREEQH